MKGYTIMNEIYLDHAATTPVHPEVAEVMFKAMTNVYGNPSSVHAFGRKARHLIDEARFALANSIHAKEKEITFTSGGTEADNLALIGTALANQHKGKHIITTNQEHHAVLHAANYLETLGFHITYLPTNESGQVTVEDVKNALTEETILVSIMFVNNETGVIQPIEEIGEVLKDHYAYFHTDAVQAYGLLEIDVKKLNVDLLSVSAHKINGPKGVGFLFAREHVVIQPLQFGGEQERKRRPGTENVINIIGFQKAVEVSQKEQENNRSKYRQLKNTFVYTLEESAIDFEINAGSSNQIDSIINISFPKTNVESMLTNLDLEGIAASSGSACTAGSVEPSHVLTAMFGAEDDRTINSIRFSFGLNNTEENILQAANKISKVVKRLTK